MKEYKSFYHIVQSDRNRFAQFLQEDLRKLKESGVQIEIQYQPAYDGHNIVHCALVMGYVENKE